MEKTEVLSWDLGHPTLPLDLIPHQTQTQLEGFSLPAGPALGKRMVIPSPGSQPSCLHLV